MPSQTACKVAHPLLWVEGILSGLMCMPYIHLALSAAACLMRVANLWCMLGWNGLAREADPH